MIDLLTPPPDHDLPPDRVADIRRAVMRSAVKLRRRWPRLGVRVLLPVLAALGVICAMIGLRPGQIPSVLGSPSPAPAVTSTPSLSSDEVDTDHGALGDADAAATIRSRDSHRQLGRPGELADVVLARRTSTDLGDGTFIVWTDTAGSTWWDADIPGVMGSGGPVSGPAATTVRLPDALHPVVRLTDHTLGWSGDEDRPDSTARNLHTDDVYLVAGSVARVEVRMTVEGHPGPWFTAPVHEGYVYIPAVTFGPHSTTEHVDEVTTIEDRAFDTDGHRVAIVER